MFTTANPSGAASRRCQRDPASGSVLLVVLVVTLILTAGAAALVSSSMRGQGAQEARVEQGRAEQIAESGLDVSFFEVQGATDVTDDTIGIATGQSNGGSYAASIAPVYAGPGIYTLTSVGTYGTHEQTVQCVISKQVTMKPGFIGLEKITMSGGASVDSFDATLGTYASQVKDGHAANDGNIASNGDIKTSGKGEIWGDAQPGPSGTYSGSMSVYGSTEPAKKDIEVPPYVYQPPPGPPPKAWNGPGTLTSGVYRFSSLTVSGNGVLTLSGNVTIYCDNKFTLSGGSSIVLAKGSQVTIHQGANDVAISGGGIVNQNELASTFAFYSASTTKIDVSGKSAYYGTFYAPKADFVTSGGSGIYGAAVAKTITLSSGTGWLHYDSSLEKPSPGGYRVEMERGW